MSTQITKNIIVKCEAAQAFNLWANFENFPHFMKNIKSVRKTGENTSHWVMEGPMGKNMEWDAKITDFQPNKRIAWSSTEGDIKTSGQVTFNGLSQQETEISAMVHYVPPAGKLGEAASHVVDNPERKLEQDLRRFKQYAENKVHSTSEII
jgi:uncharacterized membrane protein